MLPTWNAAFGKSWRRSPVGSHPTPSHPESMVGNIRIERCGNLGIDLHLLPNFNWRNGGTGGLPSCGTWNQLPNGPLKKNYGNIGPIGLLAIWPPHASDIPAMAAVMGDGNDHEEFLHLLGDARFSTLRQRCLALEKLKKHGGLQIPWTEKSVRSLLSNLHKEECTPNYIQQAWDTLKWFSTKFQTLDVTATHRLASKKKWLQETLVSTASTPQRKAVVPAKEVILALEQGAAAGGADPRRKGQIAREAIDAFILGMVRFQVGSSARFNDLQHTSPSTMKVTSNTIEMMAWQTKTASAFRIKKNPVPLIAPKLSLSGVDWWTEWSKTLTLLSSLERFQDMDYLIPTLSKDFQGVIPRPSTSDRGLRWLKEALGTPRSGPGLGHTSHLALLPGLHPRLRLINWESLGPKGNT